MQTTAQTRANDRADRASAPITPTKADQWIATHPSEWEWLVNSAPTFSFAASLLASLQKWGSLTQNQLMAVQTCIAKAKIRADKAANPTVVTATAIEAAFTKAQAAGIQRPKLRLGEFKFSPAPATGKNPGAIYIKSRDNTYLGKVAGGKLFTVAIVGADVERDIANVINDPAAAAVAYGKRWGKCSVCNRDLTDPESVSKGIGPVCAERFGFNV